MKKYVLIVLMLAGSLHFSLAQTKWEIDKAHSNIGFSVMHYVITEVEGDFKEFDGSVVSKEGDFDGAEVEFVAHLKSDDFFNAEKFPELKFKGKLEKSGDNYKLVGDLTMRDVTKQVSFDVKHNGTIALEKGKKAGFKITGTVDRFEYGIKFDRVLETGGLVVGQEVEITCNIELNESSGA